MMTKRYVSMMGLAAITLLSVIIFFDTWQSIVDIWIRSETFAHGFIVLPTSLWLIWKNKAIHGLLLNPDKTSWLGFAFALANGFLWLLASLANILVVEQYAIIGMLIGAYWFFLGNKPSKAILFPLAFLYFMVPVGEALITPLMGFTADFVIVMLRLTGIPVYREGFQFTLISGQWSVVEGCSGLRYLIASITLGVIYAYITYTKLYKRIIFTFFAIFTPVLANGLRAYMIVMIGHFSSMKLATGVDHIIYGAVFFGIVIFTMFYIGSFWRDPLPEHNQQAIQISEHTYNNGQLCSIIGVILVCNLIWPSTANWMTTYHQRQTQIQELLKDDQNWQTTAAPNWEWQPHFAGTVTESLNYFNDKNENITGVYQANFGEETPEAKLVSSQNLFIRQKDKTWRTFKQEPLTLPNSLTGQGVPAKVNLTILRNRANEEKDIIILSWYKVGPYTTNNDYIAKLYQLLKRLTFNTEPEIYMTVFSQASNDNHEQKIMLLSELIKEFN